MFEDGYIDSRNIFLVVNTLKDLYRTEIQKEIMNQERIIKYIQFIFAEFRQ